MGGYRDPAAINSGGVVQIFSMISLKGAGAVYPGPSREYKES